MDAAADVLVEISLDSVVHKAVELEDTLRTCKNNAVKIEGSPLMEPLHEPAFSFDNSPPPTTVTTQQSYYGHASSPVSNEQQIDLAAQWQRLTSYIVSLEKEVQYYKQLAEDTQLAHTKLASQIFEEGGGKPIALVATMEERVHTLGETDSDISRDNPVYTKISSNLVSGNEGSGEEKQSEDAYSYVVEGLQLGHTNSEQVSTCPTESDIRPTGHKGAPTVKSDPNYWEKLLEGDPECRALMLVFCHLTLPELCSVCRVNRKWYTVSRHPLLWRSVSITEAILGPQVLLSISQWCSHTERLTLHGLMPTMASCDEDLQSYISRTRGCLEDSLVAVLKASSETLVSLTVTECNLMITERVLWLASMHIPYLQAFSYCSDEFPPGSESLWSLANGCKCIQHLNFPPVLESPNADCFNDKCLEMIAHSWPNLLSLTVGGNDITPNGLAQVATNCKQLQYLEIIHGPDLHKGNLELLCADGGLQALTRFNLNFTPSSHVALKYLIDSCPNLKTIDLHVTLQSFFSESTESNIKDYESIIGKLKKLEKESKKILRLHEHYTR